MSMIEKIPDPIDLLSFFESEPFFSDEVDHRYGYAHCDNQGMKLVFSYAALEGWIQTTIEYNGEIISQHLSEGVESFELKSELKGEYLCSEIKHTDSVTQVEIRLKPFISIKWNTLIT
ncbi:hypothetical protein M976_00550 [Buttiauxella ferragutiae ATCC 51602]|uniref:Uncharacterized protein n=1 Tax=Buttiauxella ferragutiae ATCC 51602 TaxID=1354252 RepID=A0ABX2WCX2_9ENTR|nr:MULTISPECIES: hypothetical protein [Buttiauxella]OAT32295.1 hypothetical protein M976_00550 [Buttiauxella ferragutiae ATCC 51602]